MDDDDDDDDDESSVLDASVDVVVIVGFDEDVIHRIDNGVDVDDVDDDDDDCRR